MANSSGKGIHVFFPSRQEAQIEITTFTLYTIIHTATIFMVSHGITQNIMTNHNVGLFIFFIALPCDINSFSVATVARPAACFLNNFL